MPWPPIVLPNGKIPQYPLDKSVCEPQRQSGHGSEEKNPFTALPGIKPWMSSL